jgi:hypothetical protein
MYTCLLRATKLREKGVMGGTRGAGRDPGIFLAFFLRRRFELSSLIYEETVPIRPEDRIELLRH